jgi:hypothetical protein
VLLRPIGPITVIAITVIALALDEPLALRHDDGASCDVGWLHGGRLWVRRAGMSGRGTVEGENRTGREGEGENWTSFCVTAPPACA